MSARHPERFRLWKVEDTELPNNDPFGKVVGVSHWQIFPKEKTDEDIKKEEEQSEEDEKQSGTRPGLRTEVVDAFSSAGKAKKEEFIGRKPHVLLQAIATRPGHERRGVAGLSLGWGTAKADEMKVPAYLEASEKGVELYKRWGFEALEKLPFDATEYGYHDPLPHVCMRRPAQVTPSD